jgi:hypothetical protein
MRVAVLRAVLVWQAGFGRGRGGWRGFFHKMVRWRWEGLDVKNCFTLRSKINGLDFMDAQECKRANSTGYFADLKKVGAEGKR